MAILILFILTYIYYLLILPIKLHPLSNLTTTTTTTNNNNSKNSDNNNNNNSNNYNNQHHHHRIRLSIIDKQNTDIMIISTGDNNNNNNNNNENKQINAISQFNDRRRDMFFEDYNIKQIQVVDTIANNSINNGNSIKNKSKKISPFTKTTILTEIFTNNQSTTTTTTTEFDPLIKPQRKNILLPKLELTGRPSCLTTPDDTFCENVDNYPKNIIKQEIDFSIDQFAEIFGNKEIDGRTIMGGVDNDESVCSKTPRVIYPKMAKNQANQWIYVVNEVEYTQAVVAEICQRPGKPCAYMDSLPMGMSSSCKQKYSYKRLLALHPTEKRTYPDAFRFPSCCSCYIKYVDDFMARSNFRKIDKPINVIDTSSKSSSSSSSSSMDDTITIDQSIINITSDNNNNLSLDDDLLHQTMTTTLLPTIIIKNNQTVND